MDRHMLRANGPNRQTIAAGVAVALIICAGAVARTTAEPNGTEAVGQAPAAAIVPHPLSK